MPSSKFRIFMCSVVAGLSAIGLAPAQAAMFQTIYSFDGGDGQLPYGKLAMDKNGLLYGTTASGGPNGGGTLFRLDPTTGLLTTLYAFTTFGATGSTPAAGVVIDGKGVLYGTTQTGGLTSCGEGCGAVYKFDPSTSQLTTLAAFTGGADGRLPSGALTIYGGLLYGTTVAGGYLPAAGSSGYGVVFRLNPKTKALATLHEFNLPGANDGDGPMATLTVGPGGRLYGTASAGGAHGSGTVFSINPTTGAFAVLHAFDYHVDGSGVDCTLLFRGGKIIGTTRVGGPTAAADGAVFRLDPNTGVLTTLYSLPGGPSGIFPDPGVVRAGALLYGTNNQGGSAGAGTLFTLNPTTLTYTVIHDFTGGADGTQPSGEMLLSSSGALYGVTSGGGRGHGTIYKVTP